MKFSALTCALFICAACTSTTTSENTTDSTEISVDTEAMATSEPMLLDTTYTEVLAPSSFSSPQLYDTVAYVFSPAGLDVYATPDGDNVVGKADYRSKVILPLPLVNNAPTDTIVVDGLKGHFVEIYYRGESGYVFSGYLVGMPVPEAGLSVIDYFTKNLHLTKPATRTVHDCTCDALSSEATYEFENGIVVRDNSSYESYDDGVTFRSKITLQEVYLFARYFYTRLSEQVPEFPVSAPEEKQEGDEEEQEDYFNVSIGAREGRISSIVVSGGEGCSEEEAVFEGDHDDEIVMSSNGGC